jgi:hypothetical protein
MNRRVLKVILVLVSMLFLNIEAAHAGLVTKLRLYIQAEFPPQHLLFLTFGLFSLGLFAYVVFTPLRINNERLTWLNYFASGTDKNSMRHKRLFVKRTSDILLEKKAA